jgi:hypothetical protein
MLTGELKSKIDRVWEVYLKVIKLKRYHFTT